jgi:hypothetical protein
MFLIVQISNTSEVDITLIESRTQDLPKASRLSNRDYRAGARTEVDLFSQNF